MCKTPRLVLHSKHCNNSCDPSSYDDGECGGHGYISLYEQCKYLYLFFSFCSLTPNNFTMKCLALKLLVINTLKKKGYIIPYFYKVLISWSVVDSEREASFSGLCLVCSTNGSRALQSWECDEDAYGLCGIRPICTSSSMICLHLVILNCFILIIFQTVTGRSENRNWTFTTMDSYWHLCKSRNEYITGNVDAICRNETTWTGLRKYFIGILIHISTVVELSLCI